MNLELWQIIVGGIATVLGSGGLGAYFNARLNRATQHEDRAWNEVKELRGEFRVLTANLDKAELQISDLKLENALLKRDLESYQKDAQKAIEREQLALAQVNGLREELHLLRQQLGGSP